MANKELLAWKRKKSEVEARIQQLEALREKTRLWLQKAGESRIERESKSSIGPKSGNYQQFTGLISERLPKVIKETAVKLNQARLEQTEIERRIEELQQQQSTIIPLAIVVSLILLLGLGMLFIKPAITGLSVENASISLPPSVELYTNAIDAASVPISISPAVKKEKSIDDIIRETKLNVPRDKIKEIKQVNYASEEVTFTDWKYGKGLVIHQPLIDGKAFAEAVPLADKDAFTYSADFDGTSLEMEFAAAEIKNDAVGRQFRQSKSGTDREWKIAYSYLLPALNFTVPLRVSSSSPIIVEDASIAQLHSGSFILSFEEEHKNGYNIQVEQVSAQVVYVYLSKNYTEEGKAVDDEMIIDPTLTISGTTTELCGTVDQYDLIDINTNGVLQICQQNITGGGLANISLGYFGNFSLDASSRIVGLGAMGGAGRAAGGNGAVATQGNDGNNGTNGSLASTPNGGGGGSGAKVGNNDAAAGAGGGFGGAGGKGGLSASGTTGLGGVTYGAYNALALKMGSGGGGASSDSANAGGYGGGGIKIITGAGGWVGLRGTINLTGQNGTNAPAATADSAGGGGGSGGHVMIIAGTLNMASGVVRANGGGGGLGTGTDSCPGGGGGGGRIYIIYNTLQANGTTFTTNHGFLGGNITSDAACNNPSDSLGPAHGANGTFQMNATHFDRMPAISLSAPANNTVNTTDNTPEFFIYASDDMFAQPYLNCTLYVANATYPATEPFHLASNNTVFNATKTIFTANSSLSNGPFTWWVDCRDAANQWDFGAADLTLQNQNTSETRNLTISIAAADANPPIVQNFFMNVSNASNFTNGVVQINATVNDSEAAVSGVIFGISNPVNASQFNLTATVGGSYYFSNLALNTMTDAIYQIYLYASDTNNNVNTGIANLTFGLDRAAPAISNFWMNHTNASNFSSSLVRKLLFNATINDTTLSVQEVRFGFYNGNATGFNVTATKNSTLWAAEAVPSVMSDGIYTVRISANDTVNNRNYTIANISFTLDRTPPDVSTFFMNTSNATTYSLGTGTTIVINATLNDSLTTVQTVTFGILNNENSSQFNITATKQGSYWYTNLGMNTLSAGLYTIWLYGNDSVGNVNDSVANLSFTVLSDIGPNITFVSNISAVSIIEGGSRRINFSFLASDFDGRGDLDNTSAQVRINLIGEADRFNTSCTPLATIGSSINYSCSVDVWYFDGAGFWTVNASIRDNAGSYIENASVQFTVQETTAFAIGPSALAWPTLELGTTNRTSNNDPITLNNTGNKDIATTGITLTGYNLRGLTTTSEFINAPNFSVSNLNGTSSCSGIACLECNGTITANATIETLPNAILSAGNNSRNYQNDTSGQENLFFCLMTVPSGISRQTYDTSANNQTAPWVITIT